MGIPLLASTGVDYPACGATVTAIPGSRDQTMQTVSAVLVCLNIENTIDRCLDSVAWCDEIVVVDAFSSDATLDRARRHTDRIHQRTYDGYSRQLAWACAQATGDWVFVIDGDEVCSPQLAARCRAVLAAPAGPEDPVAHRVARRAWAYGRRLSHGGYGNEHVLRFARRDSVLFRHRLVHGAMDADGRVGRMAEWLEHHTWADLFQHVQRINTYTSLEMANILAERPEARASWARIVFSPAGHFLRRFVRHAGWRDGWHGFAAAWLDGVHTGLLYFKLWEYRMRRAEGGDALPPADWEAVRQARRRT
jgi:glycosyltransferase involved in cell wall biosynthesis